MICASAHGLPCAARPTITASAPVVARTACARAREVTSPEAITGTSTSSTSSAVSEWSAKPVYICFAERGWSVSDAAPASTSRGPTTRQSREPFAVPRRIFTETGSAVAPATASTIRAAWSGSSRSEAPAPVFVTFLHGAAEVDVDDVRAGRLDHPRRLGHRDRVGAEDLDRERVLVGGDAQVAERLFVAVLDSRDGDHLRADEPGAVAAALPAECLDAHAGHRSEHEPARDLDAAEGPGLVEIDAASAPMVAVALAAPMRRGYYGRPLHELRNDRAFEAFRRLL